MSTASLLFEFTCTRQFDALTAALPLMASAFDAVASSAIMHMAFAAGVVTAAIIDFEVALTVMVLTPIAPISVVGTCAVAVPEYVPSAPYVKVGVAVTPGTFGTKSPA